jgi:hypothetical protein
VTHRHRFAAAMLDDEAQLFFENFDRHAAYVVAFVAGT